MEGKNSSTLTFQGAPPIETTSAIHKDAVKVVVLHPHSGARKMWKFLNENWREFGKREIVIKQIKYSSLFHTYSEIIFEEINHKTFSSSFTY